MEFAILNACIVLFSGLVAYWEGRLTHKQLGEKSIPWLWHGGVWADLLLLTPVIYYISPFFQEWEMNQVVMYGLISIGVTAICHLLYAKTQPIAGHIVEPKGLGFGKLPIGGWYHFAYATVILAVVALFYLQPGTEKPTMAVSILLTAYTLVSVIQPGWYTHKIVDGKGYLDLQGFLVSALLVGAIWYGYHVA